MKYQMALTYFSAKCRSPFSFEVVYAIENVYEVEYEQAVHCIIFFYIFPSKPNVIDLETLAQGDFVSP